MDLLAALACFLAEYSVVIEMILQFVIPELIHVASASKNGKNEPSMVAVLLSYITLVAIFSAHYKLPCSKYYMCLKEMAGDQASEFSRHFKQKKDFV